MLKIFRPRGCLLSGVCQKENCRPPKAPRNEKRGNQPAVCAPVVFPELFGTALGAAVFVDKGDGDKARDCALELIKKDGFRFVAVAFPSRCHKMRKTLLECEGFHLFSYGIHNCMLYFVILTDRDESGLYCEFRTARPNRTGAVLTLLDGGWVAIRENDDRLLFAKRADDRHNQKNDK